ncbi:MAG TPA: hypothetical protein VMP08_25145, partial [Anaerolineae bacterium]|nr:hypothetical protein [Anaerolineae bacterium]
MTTFQDLQAEHEALLNRHEAPTDPEQFWADVQHFIEHVRIAAESISTPRERDQLRAILRFWASYVYDKTGAYPDTTLRPALNKNASTSPPPSSKDVDQIGVEIGQDKFTIGKVDVGTLQVPIKPVLIVVSALVVCLIVFAVLFTRPTNVTTPAVPITPGASANVVPT